MMVGSLDAVAKQFPELSFTPKTIILDPVKALNDIYYLEEGYVRMYLLSEDGEELTLHVFRPGSYFPLMLVLTDSPNKYYFEAVTPVLVRKVPKAKIITVLKDHPDILFDLATRLSGGIIGYLVKVESLLLHDAYKRVVSILCYLGERFSETLPDGSVRINLSITHYLLSTWVGLTRETVSRQIEKLEKNGLIVSKDNTVTIKNFKALQKEME
ncbi:MAG: Crp/Fnr family transcriptional regulator [Patescibacteria group bacterium]|nr:Crp/Fnr family transcriptional regulator [Patescibacteria group bacterium]MDE2588942.1 Crp/Fnr family transcriptional regulator [Patescibacteria group bacterium]